MNKNNDYAVIVTNSTGNATFNYSIICSKTCTTTLYGSKLAKVLLTENNAISFSLFSVKQSLYLVCFGYLSQFSTSIGWGRVNFEYFCSMKDGYLFGYNSKTDYMDMTYFSNNITLFINVSVFLPYISPRYGPLNLNAYYTINVTLFDE